MLGTVLTHLRTKVTSLKARLNATASMWTQRLKQYGVQHINQKIQSAITTSRAWTKQSKEQLLAHSRTLLDTSMKLVTTLALLILGVLGLLAHLIVLMIQRLASKLWKREQ